MAVQLSHWPSIFGIAGFPEVQMIITERSSIPRSPGVARNVKWIILTSRGMLADTLGLAEGACSLDLVGFIRRITMGVIWGGFGCKPPSLAIAKVAVPSMGAIRGGALTVNSEDL